MNRALPTEDAGLPPSSVELELIEIMMEAHLATLPRRRATRFVQVAAEAAERRRNAVTPIGHRDRAAQDAVARRAALVWFSAKLPQMLAKLL